MSSRAIHILSPLVLLLVIAVMLWRAPAFTSAATPSTSTWMFTGTQFPPSAQALSPHIGTINGTVTTTYCTPPYSSGACQILSINLTDSAYGVTMTLANESETGIVYNNYINFGPDGSAQLIAPGWYPVQGPYLDEIISGSHFTGNQYFEQLNGRACWNPIPPGAYPYTAGLYQIGPPETVCGYYTLTNNTPTPTPTPQPQPRPIIFIPGISGSYLEDAESSPQEMWPQLQQLAYCLSLSNTAHPPAKSPQWHCQDNALRFLQLASDGSTPFNPGARGNVDVAAPPRPTLGPLGGVISSANVNILWFVAQKFHIYDATWSNLEQSGYHLALTDADLQACAATKKCFIPAAVDWRKSSAFNAGRILTLIQHVIALTKTDRVNILAHSQGGLVTNALLHLPASVGLVNRVVTLGTPFLGAAKLLAVELSNLCEFPVPEGCAIAPDILQKLTLNFPGAMELLPDQLYDEASGGILFNPLAGGGYTPLSYQQALQYIQQQLAALNRDMTLVNAAQQFHDAVDVWSPADPKVQLLRAVGYDATANVTQDCQESSSPTPPGFVITCPRGAVGGYDPSSNGLFDINSTILGLSTGGTTRYGNGDGTVPWFSAGEYNPALGFDERAGQSDRYYCAVNHMGLAQSPDVWHEAQEFLEGQNLPSGIGLACPDGTDGDLADVPLS